MRVIKLKEVFSTFKFFWGVSSKFAILIIPFLVAGFGLVFDFNLNYVVQLFIFGIAANDMVSILANIISIRRGVYIKSEDYITNILEGVRKIFTKILKSQIEKVNNKLDENDK